MAQHIASKLLVVLCRHRLTRHTLKRKFWRNFRRWLRRKIQLPVQPLATISSKLRHCKISVDDYWQTSNEAESSCESYFTDTPSVMDTSSQPYKTNSCNYLSMSVSQRRFSWAAVDVRAWGSYDHICFFLRALQCVFTSAERRTTERRRLYFHLYIDFTSSHYFRQIYSRSEFRSCD